MINEQIDGKQRLVLLQVCIKQPVAQRTWLGFALSGPCAPHHAAKFSQRAESCIRIFGPNHFDESLATLEIISKTVKLIGSRPGRAVLLLRMAFWVTVLSLVVKFFALPRALRLVSPSPAVKSLTGETSEQELATAIDALLGLNVLVFRPVCWKRAAILHRYLTLRGKATTINFGLRKGTGGTLDGHAWLEADGLPIFESRILDYTVTYVFPSNAPFKIELASLAKH